MLYAPVTCLGSCQLGSIWTSADGEVPEKEMSTQKKSVWFYLECKKVVCIFLTKDKWSTSISVPQERLNYRKAKSRSLQTLKQFFTIHKTNQALQKVRTQKTCGETWRANFLNSPLQQMARKYILGLWLHTDFLAFLTFTMTPGC